MARNRALVAYFSLAKSTAKVAEALITRLSDHFEVSSAPIVPVKNHGYKYWLLLSFFPNLGVRIEPIESNLAGYDLLILGTPKWTLNCPPVTEFLKLLQQARDKYGAVYVVHKGFDEKRYLESLKRKLEGKGMKVISSALFSSLSVSDGSYERTLKSFAEEIFQGVRREGDSQTRLS